MIDSLSSRRRGGARAFAGAACLLAGLALIAVAQQPKPPSQTAAPPQSKYGSQAVRLFHAREYLQTHEAPDFWALMPYYVHQFNERACSVASATMVVNALRSQVELTTADELITQEKLLKQVCNPRWANDVGPNGESVTIEELGEYVQESLKLFGPRQYDVQAVRVDSQDKGLRERIRRMLVENERSDDDFVMVVFWQAAFTEDPEGETGHIAPLAAYDAAHERALVFDPDRKWYEPYWVPLDTLVAGMARTDPDTGKSRGFIWVRTKP
jgi:hypothetical protein